MAGIYIHIPFCKKRCHYCDFYKTLDTGMSGSFLQSLLREIELKKSYLQPDDLIETIYFGGGTPSVLDLSLIRSILSAIKKAYTLIEDPEITIEINPDDVGKTYLRGLVREGINRFSIGVQSWNDDILKMLNRRHDSAQAIKAVNNARAVGIDNISLDLIYGIPGLSMAEWERTLLKTFKLGVEHISAYHLTIEKETMFGKMKEHGELKEVDEEISEQQFKMLTDLARKHKYIHYEISNLCKEGYYSKHNTNYWRQVNYIGLGPSAHSYNGYSRQWNISNLKEYINLIANNKETFEKELLGEETRFNEYIMTSLRTIWGIDMNYLESSFSKEMHDYLLSLASRFIKYGMIERSPENHLKLTDQGKMIADNIITELIMA